ncbi:MAG: hypothetical protein OEZ36_10820, partial [Spirochaetota bacterium]|nr:hypothetical protein [Spirochaetota bacterium]
LSFMMLACDPDPVYQSDINSYHLKHLERSNLALFSWGIGLTEDITGTSRNLGDGFTAYNPKNWIIMTNDSTTGEGVPLTMANYFANNPLAIGVCSVRMDSVTAEIVDSTLIMRQSYQEGTDPELEKQSVYTHEVGHCLGLQHSDLWGGTNANIMWPNTSGADTPSVLELAAVADTYTPVQIPTGTSISGNRMLFNHINAGADVVRHWTFPVFTIYPYKPLTRALRPSKIKPGKNLTGPVTEVIYTYYKSGSSKSSKALRDEHNCGIYHKTTIIRK